MNIAMTYIQMMNKINLSQVFLWFQEKSLLSAGSLLHNPTPGVDFETRDLVRNLLLSKHMESPIQE